MRYSPIFKRFRRSTHLQLGPILCLVLLLDIAALPHATSKAASIILMPAISVDNVQVDPIDEPEQPPPDLPAAIEPGEKKAPAEPIEKPAAKLAEPELPPADLPPASEPALKAEDPTIKAGGLQPIETLDDPIQAKPAKSLDDPAQAKSTKQVPALADEAPRDDSVMRTQNEAPPLGAPGSSSTPASSSPTSPPPGTATAGADPNAQYRPGAQGVGIYVEVVGPPSANLQQETTFRIIVRNAMRTQAFGVVVKDILPDTLEFVKSQPEAKKEGSTLAWDLGEMPIGSEKTLTVVAKPVKVGSVEPARPAPDRD